MTCQLMSYELYLHKYIGNAVINTVTLNAVIMLMVQSIDLSDSLPYNSLVAFAPAMVYSNFCPINFRW